MQILLSQELESKKAQCNKRRFDSVGEEAEQHEGISVKAFMYKTQALSERGQVEEALTTIDQ